MSGSSYEYAYSDMQSGELDKMARYIDFAIADFERCADEPMRDWRYATDEERRSEAPPPGSIPATAGCVMRMKLSAHESLLTNAGMHALRVRLHRAARMLAAMKNEARELATLFHDLEWVRSSDYGADQLQDTAREYAAKKLAG